MPRKAAEIQQKQKDDHTASETSDLGEDEYEVERIVKHRTAKGGKGYDYMLKWKNYPESQNTWENAKNLICEDLIKEYWDGLKSSQSQSGRKRRSKEPNEKASSIKRDSSEAATPTKKRKSTKSPEKEAKRSSGKTKPIDVDDEKKEDGEDAVDAQSDTSEIQVDEDYVPPEGIDWEEEVLLVDSVEQRDNKLQAIVQWQNGTYTEHLTSVIREKCPKKLVDFYEARLKFTVKEEL